MPYKLTVNGKPFTADVPADMPLLWVLRDVLNYKGTKFGCGAGLCGACTVHVGGKPVRSCQTLVSKVADDEGWKTVKATLIKNVGTNSIPVLKVEDADFGQNRTLYVKHDHDGRDLHIEYAEKSLNYLQRLWGREVVLETVLDGKRSLLCCNDRGFSVRALK